jgi:vancomycin resistance protein YoaR
MIAKKIVFIFLFFLALNSIFFLHKEINKLQINYQNKVYPNIFIDDLKVGDKTENEIKDIYQKINHQLKTDKVIVYLKDKPIATFSGEQLNLHYDEEFLIKKAFSYGREKNLKERISTLIKLFVLKNPVYIKSTINYDKSIITNFIQAQEDTHNKPARNALFKFENNRVILFKKEENGEFISSKEFLEEFENLIIKNRNKEKKIIIKTKIIKPEITLASTNNFGIEELIGFGQSDFSGSINERIHNLTLAASKFNGILIPPEKIFSFNEIVGDISSLSGYKPAYIIKDGKTILGDGGGVCQVSTTLFRAALNTGLPIIERHAHAYRVHYYENDSKPGLDATVFAPYVDLKIKNNTPAYLLIETEIDKNNNLLFFYLYGKKDGRKIFISPITVWDIVPPPESKYQEDPTLKKGVVKQIEWPAWGAKSSFTYKVSKNKQTIFEKRFYSSYRPWPAVFLVGVAD